MKIKAIEVERYQDYKLPSMFVAFPKCSFKCEKECGKRVCQNSALATAPVFEMDVNHIVEAYLNNPITSAVILGGLEPFDSFEDMVDLVETMRTVYHRDDTFVIYTGYTEDEIATQLNVLKRYKNIIVKFGRFVPDDARHYDETLGVWLASRNQYAIQIS